MRITIATGPIFPVPAVRGGAVQRLWEGLAHEFAQCGHEVTIFAREFPGQAKEEVVNGIRYLRRGGYGQSTSIKRDLIKCFFYTMGVARHVPSGDVVVTNDFWMPAVLPWMNTKAGKVVVNANRFPKRQYGLYGGASAFAAASAAVADAIKMQSSAAERRTLVVPNGIDRIFLEQPACRDGRERMGSVRILFAGRIHPEKGLKLLAEALRLLHGNVSGVQPWECVLMGPVAQSEGGGGEKFAAELRRMLDGLPVRFEAPVYDTFILRSVYDEADIFVYPSLADAGESFGLAPLEGMARGLVPVVSGLAVFREYLQPGVNGMVFDHRSGDAATKLAAALQELVADADKRRRMGTAGRIMAERFSPAAIAKKYLQLFEKVVSGDLR